MKKHWVKETLLKEIGEWVGKDIMAPEWKDPSITASMQTFGKIVLPDGRHAEVQVKLEADPEEWMEE
jgi:hypothetical protein